MKYDFKIVHIADVKHQTADALSGLPPAGLHNNELHEEILVMEITRTKNHDPNCQQNETYRL